VGETFPHQTLDAVSAHDDQEGLDLSLDERPRSLSDLVFETLHQAIVNKVLEPGAPVTEPDLAKRLRVSKTPVREALLRLRQLGLIEAEGARGLRVVQLSADDVRQTYEIREALESFTASRAALRATSSDRSHIMAAAQESYEAAKIADKDGFRAADRELHGTIARIADNSRIWQLIADASALISTLLQRDFPSGHGLTNCGAAHVRIAEAIVAGNAEEAARAMTAHIDEVRGLMLEVMHSA
jgi:GntR family transcriptional regulator, rspAB operon transcriptional repressor